MTRFEQELHDKLLAACGKPGCLSASQIWGVLEFARLPSPSYSDYGTLSDEERDLLESIEKAKISPRLYGLTECAARGVIAKVQAAVIEWDNLPTQLDRKGPR